ncbi:Arrestin-N domain-containing protein [Mycena sanguinolenta]|uniref:Arrestin-N domain-containing protein n=1 Tax=Mycena sanguinolenta TaxID=230812 RepID=A0A8H6XMK2_9AGAR|nr:Arrestin-N domain-containing protein [Mycena sanguinolenta]
MNNCDKEFGVNTVTLSLPDLPFFPTATSIPYSLHIVTETKTVDRTERPEDKHGKPLFPVPPTQSTQLQLNLRRAIQIRAHSRVSYVENILDLQSIRRLSGVPQKRNVEALVDEPEWVPKDTSKDRGFWRRSVHFNSTLDFPYAPTTSAKTLKWTYTLRFIVPFPGRGNDLKIEHPIHLGPSTPCPPPPIGATGTSSSSYTDVPPLRPSPTLDLPP